MIQRITAKGVVRGKTVVLEGEPELPEGQEVTVSIQFEDKTETSGVSGLEAAFGGWADDLEGVDEFIRWTREQRGTPPRGTHP
jgi:hypothetical protein